MKTTLDMLPIQSMAYTEKRPSASNEKAAEGLESYFVSLLLNEMQKTASFTEKGYMEQTYFTMVNQRLSEFIAKKGIGIKDMIVRYLEQGGPKVSLSSVDNIDNKDR